MRLKGKKPVEVKAWCIVGSPKFAPELRNISTLDDNMNDVGVRYMNLVPQLFNQKRWASSGGWNPDYVANFKRDILPIIEGSTVNTKYGPVKTDHILFIAAGAFHVSKPSDLIP